MGSDVSTAIHTTQGRVMGTLHYMSPEQVLGKELDGRTDLFSLGVVLYEMTTGRLPFSGAQVGEVTDRILHGQPEAVARFNYEVPAELERIIRKCLEKDRERRYQLAREVRADLSKLKEESAANSSLTAGKSVASPQSAKKSWTWLGVFGLGLVALVAASMAWYFLRQQPVSSELPSPPIPLTSYPGTELSPNFSPDGSQVAFSWNGERQDNFDIYVKLVDRSDALHLTTHPAADTSPAWSPDGRQIAFVREGTIYLISPLGGGERKVADVQAVWIGWTENSKSLVVSSGKPFNRRLTLLSVDTGKMKELTGPFAEGFDLTPAVSPDGLNLVFVRYIASVSSDIYLMPLAGGEPRRLTRGQREINGLAWTGDGREVVYSSQGSLWRRSAEAQLDSPSKRVDGVDPTGAVQPAISRPDSVSHSRLAYVSVVYDTNIWVRETTGSSASKLIGSTRPDTNPQFSPDGHRIVFRSARSGSPQIWVANRDGSNPLQLTWTPKAFVNAPRWSPDGKTIVFTSAQNNNQDIYSVSADGGPVHRFTTAPSREGRPSWSRDGRWIYFYSTRTGNEEIWKMPAGGGEEIQLTTGGGHESFESPNGKLLYYEDYGVKGLRSISIESYSGPREGSPIIPEVQPGLWAVTEQGIYFVEVHDRNAAFRDAVPLFVPLLWEDRTPRVSHRIKFYDFRTHQFTQIGTIEEHIVRNDSSFCATWDGSTIAWSQIDQRESDLMMIENFR